MSSAAAEHRTDRHRRYRVRRMSLWHRFVMLVGYAAILYGLIRGIVYVLVLLEGMQ
ncbi:MAG: hypothetical protein IJ189_10700 [Clostridia bacterium]|nr:hypothetical protein [Clostridia bacterium]